MKITFFLGPLALGLLMTGSLLAKPLPVPVVGATYTIGQLRNIIRTNSKLADFIVPIKNQKAMTAAQCAGAGIASMDGSWSVDRAGLKGIIDANLAAQVVVYYDNDLMDKLVTTKRVVAANKARFARILVYFEFNGYRFYLTDPWPRLGATYARGRKSVSGVDSILKSWGI